MLATELLLALAQEGTHQSELPVADCTSRLLLSRLLCLLYGWQGERDPGLRERALPRELTGSVNARQLQRRVCLCCAVSVVGLLISDRVCRDELPIGPAEGPLGSGRVRVEVPPPLLQPLLQLLHLSTQSVCLRGVGVPSLRLESLVLLDEVFPLILETLVISCYLKICG